MMHWQGLTDLTWEDFTPSRSSTRTRPASRSRPTLNGTTQRAPERHSRTAGWHLQATGTGQGGIWHLAIAGMLYDLDIDPAKVPWVPSEGAAPGLQDLVAGGVHIVPVSLVEARSLIDAGRVKSLALMGPDRAALFPTFRP